MGKPKFEFIANNASPEDESGVAVWQYADDTTGVKIAVRQEFQSFRAAFAMNGLIAVAFDAGEAEGYARCERAVLAVLRST